MKRTPMIMALGYLIISITVAVVYKSVDVFGKTTSVWSTAVFEDGDSGEPEPTVIPTETPEPTAIPTETPEPTAIPAETPELTAIPTETPEPTAIPTETPEPTAIPTETPEPTAIPKATPKPEVKEESTEPGKVTVKYNGKEISYLNTSYRMKEETLEQIVSMVRKEPYISSFVLYDINSEAAICYNEKKYYPVASTVKATFAMTCLWQIEEGLYSLEDTMEYTSEYKVKGDGTIKKKGVGTVLTIKELVEQAILVSDDIGYLMLQGYFGHERYNQFLKKLGNRVTIDGKDVKWGKTSALDSMRNWQEVYRYINSESENAAFFAGLLQNTNKSYIRNALGKDYVVYNKMGWVYDQCCHDHAIVMDEQPYLMMIMTMGDVRTENQTFMENLALILNGVHEEMVAE